MDNIFCNSLIAARSYMQLPWAILLEGHAWWHILTGIGELIPPFLRPFPSFSWLKLKDRIC